MVELIIVSFIMGFVLLTTTTTTTTTSASASTSTSTSTTPPTLNWGGGGARAARRTQIRRPPLACRGVRGVLDHPTILQNSEP